MNTIAIRKEDKNRWERRTPLTPDHVAELVRSHGLDIIVQPSARRVFPDLDYERAGARLSLDLETAAVIFGVKEVPVDRILPSKTYVIFPHVTKEQAYNVAMLRAFLKAGCTLIDYELIVDSRRGRRLIFFGRHAGYAGMIDTLSALGQRLASEGFLTPLEEIRSAHQYSSLEEAMRDVARIGEQIRHQGLPVGLRPVVFAFTGSGNVTQGALEVFDRLPFVNIPPEELGDLVENRDRPRNLLFRTILERHHRYERVDGGAFDAIEFRDDPGKYRGALEPLLPHMTVLVNGVFWDTNQPRLVTRDSLRSIFDADPQPKLRVIGDITCDIDGSIEPTVRATTPGEPTFVYDPETGNTTPGHEGRGVVVMAVDNLPSELPRDASEHFGDSLAGFVPAMARCDWTAPYDDLLLPPEIHRAVIAHRGRLTARWAHLARLIERTEEA